MWLARFVVCIVITHEVAIQHAVCAHDLIAMVAVAGAICSSGDEGFDEPLRRHVPEGLSRPSHIEYRAGCLALVQENETRPSRQ